jgi:hypothetical protein
VLGINAWVVMLLLLGFVILCRSAGAITYTIVFLPLVLYASARAQTRVAAVLAMLMFAYPVCRSAGLVPIDAINNFVLSVFGGDRAQSLAYRLKYEGLVMERALKRILFGWGGYARPFPHDPDTGKDFFAIDGLWVIVIGSRGVVGFTAIFGMLVLPIWRARHTLVRIPEPRDRVLVGSLALMGVIFVTDLIPNASVDPYLTFLIGVLAGTERGFDPPSSA